MVLERKIILSRFYEFNHSKNCVNRHFALKPQSDNSKCLIFSIFRQISRTEISEGKRSLLISDYGAIRD